jgi:hypothetical protein
MARHLGIQPRTIFPASPRRPQSRRGYHFKAAYIASPASCPEVTSTWNNPGHMV